MAHYYNHLIKKQQNIENQREDLLAIASQIVEAKANGDNNLQVSLARKYISQGRALLKDVKEIQERYQYLKEVDIDPSFDMSWLYVTAMKTMQDVYDYGISSMHLQLIKEWPELTDWLRDRIKH